MKLIQNMKNKIFKKKLANLGFDMENEEESRLAEGINKAGFGGDHFVECMKDAIATQKLQKVCETISGKKEAGRLLQREPLVIQCGTCGEDFSVKKGVIFVDETINLETTENIIKHLCECDGIICDCGVKRPYLDDCKKCKIKWTESAHNYLGYHKDYKFTDKQKKQIEKYKKRFVNVLGEER